MTFLRIVVLLLLVTTVGTLAFSAPVAADTNLTIGGQAQVANTNGDGVRIRAEPSVSAASLRMLSEGWRVQVLAGPVRGHDGGTWYKVSHTGAVGYIVADYLTAGGLAVGETAQVTTDDGSALRLRDEPGGAILVTMPHGAQVAVIGGPTRDAKDRPWYRVRYQGQTGWALSAYLQPAGMVATQQRQTASQPSASQASRPAPPAAAPAPAPRAASSGSGASIAATARQYIGTRYVWGGSSPAGFDCSGFTRYVIQRVVGVNIGHEVFAQSGAGVSVAASDLQPGDLVFFKNTYRWGLSHVGIYIGGGQMVNAQSESTGVRVANIWDSYWGPRYYGARRVR